MSHTPISQIEIDNFYQQNQEKLTSFRVYNMSTKSRDNYLKEQLLDTFGDRFKVDHSDTYDDFLISWSIDRVNQSIDQEYDRSVKRKFIFYFGLGVTGVIAVFLGIISYLHFT